MKVAVTGASGFLGRAIVRELRRGALGEISQLRFLDLHRPSKDCGANETYFVGNICDRDLQRRFLDNEPDILFHLVSMPGGAAETRFAEGKAINVDASLALLEAVARPSSPPIVIYASSVAALGPTQASVVTDDMPLRPIGSYGAHKLMVEHFVADLSRLGVIDGRSLRPAGIVARPRSEMAGFASAWMSEIFHAGIAGEPFEAPFDEGSAWWFQSIACVAAQFIHAARLSASDLPRWRSWTLPACVATIAEIRDCLAAETGNPSRVSFASDRPGLPKLSTSLADSLGFRSDGTVNDLVKSVLSDISGEHR